MTNRLSGLLIFLLAYQLVIVPLLYKGTVVVVRNPDGAAGPEHNSRKEKDVASVRALLVGGIQRGH